MSLIFFITRSMSSSSCAIPASCSDQPFSELCVVSYFGVLDLLLADLPPARLHRGIVNVGRPGMHHVSRAELVDEVLRIGGVGRILHPVQVVLAELAGGVAHALQRRGDGHRLDGKTDR